MVKIQIFRYCYCEFKYLLFIVIYSLKSLVIISYLIIIVISIAMSVQSITMVKYLSYYN